MRISPPQLEYGDRRNLLSIRNVCTPCVRIRMCISAFVSLCSSFSLIKISETLSVSLYLSLYFLSLLYLPRVLLSHALTFHTHILHELHHKHAHTLSLSLFLSLSSIFSLSFWSIRLLVHSSYGRKTELTLWLLVPEWLSILSAGDDEDFRQVTSRAAEPYAGLRSSTGEAVSPEAEDSEDKVEETWNSEREAEQARNSSAEVEDPREERWRRRWSAWGRPEVGRWRWPKNLPEEEPDGVGEEARRRTVAVAHAGDGNGTAKERG